MLFAQDYLISFAGDGAGTSVDSVKVENLTQGTNLTLQGNQVLHLKANISGVPLINQGQSPGIRFYPNPTNDFTQMEFDIPGSGVAQIGLYDISGREIAQTDNYLNQGRHVYQVSGLGSGVYLVKIKSTGITLSGKLVSNNSVKGKPTMSYSQHLPYAENMEILKSTTAEVLMQYASGDWLKFTGISGNYRTVVTDAPTGSKTLPFSFVPCTDADGQNYSVVKIGSQWWMDENLQTTKLNDSTAIPIVTNNANWASLKTGACCWYENDAATYQSIYGALYNWYAVNTGKLCPSGWHVPSDTEWKQLDMALGMTQAQADNTGWRGTNQGTQMKTTSGWYNNGNGTNTSGFSGLPGGYRNLNGYFYRITTDGYWWSSTEVYTDFAWERDVSYNHASIYRNNYGKGAGFSVRCVRDDNATVSLPSVSTKVVSDTTATCGGNVTNDGGAKVTARGVCWNTTGNPTIMDSHTTDGSGLGEFTSSLTGLVPLTTYYVRAYATNDLGTAYGEEKNFTTIITWSETGIITDVRDGKTYKTVKIGNQWWMDENLAYLPTVSPPTVGSNTALYYYVYGYSGTDITAAKATANYSIYGVLYNWSAAMAVCPSGWHLPSDAEWEQLEMALGMTQAQADSTGFRGTNQGTQMKTTNGWYNNGNGTNTNGFSGLPGGFRYYNGGFDGVTSNGSWWSSTEFSMYDEAWARLLSYYFSNVYRYFTFKSYGFSVRCVRDN